MLKYFCLLTFFIAVAVQATDDNKHHTYYGIIFHTNPKTKKFDTVARCQIDISTKGGFLDSVFGSFRITKYLTAWDKNQVFQEGQFRGAIFKELMYKNFEWRAACAFDNDSTHHLTFPISKLKNVDRLMGNLSGDTMWYFVVRDNDTLMKNWK